MLSPNCNDRPTAEELLRHPWVRGEQVSNRKLVGTIKTMKQFNVARKKGFSTFLNLYSHWVGETMRKKDEITKTTVFQIFDPSEESNNNNHNNASTNNNESGSNHPIKHETESEEQSGKGKNDKKNPKITKKEQKEQKRKEKEKKKAEKKKGIFFVEFDDLFSRKPCFARRIKGCILWRA